MSQHKNDEILHLGDQLAQELRVLVETIPISEQGEIAYINKLLIQWEGIHKKKFVNEILKETG